MGFRNINLKSEYRSLIDDIPRDFYIPLLNEAVIYKRAVGFFSSTALVEVSKGITGLIKNNGSMQLIASPHLSEEDLEAMSKGYSNKQSIIENALIHELKDVQSIEDKSRLDLLAHLISENILDIKIALTSQNGSIGMYHEKMGIIEDTNGDKIAFSGSMNESLTALTLNYETIDVFLSWDGDQARVNNKENAFNSIWNNFEPGVETIEVPNLTQEIIKRYKISSVPNYKIEEDIANTELIINKPSHNGAIVPEKIKLHKYQIDAIDSWESKNFRGIFDMATGTGKTITGLGALARLSDFTEGKIAAIIVCPYQHLVEQWVEDIELFGMKPIIGYSTSFQKDWKEKLEKAILAQNLKVKNREFLCLVTTNATFASDFVQNQIRKIKSDIVLIVDEAHNFGANYLSKTLNDNFKYRLALSATLNRHNDEFGTQKLINYFGEKCIEYSLERAIEEGKLTPYKYFPIIVTLNDEELEKYDNLSSEIGKCIIVKNGKKTLSEKGKMLCLMRARLVAGVESKIPKLEECIFPYKDDKHILVYCGATRVLNSNEDYSSTDREDLRQIDIVTDLLGNKLDMQVSQFTSKEDNREREIIKNEFDRGENLQALIAIKCLDEGVNIPKIKVAFILASTTNPKEYIQRRGRVLRLSKGKEFAEIYDFITLPREIEDVHSLTEFELSKYKTLVKNELCRAIEFTRLSLNEVTGRMLIDDIKEAYNIREELLEFEEEYLYE